MNCKRATSFAARHVGEGRPAYTTSGNEASYGVLAFQRSNKIGRVYFRGYIIIPLRTFQNRTLSAILNDVAFSDVYIAHIDNRIGGFV